MNASQQISAAVERLIPTIDQALVAVPTPALRARALKKILGSVDPQLSQRVAETMVTYEDQGLSSKAALRKAIKDGIEEHITKAALGYYGGEGLSGNKTVSSGIVRTPAAPAAPTRTTTTTTTTTRPRDVAGIIRSVTEGITATAGVVTQISGAVTDARTARANAAAGLLPLSPMGPGLDPYGMPLAPVSTTPWGLIAAGAAVVLVGGYFLTRK